MPATPRPGRYDAVVVGGGHNGLAAAAYLARAGRSVAVFEAAATLGGATQSVTAFDGVDVKLSRYAYLVSLLPDAVCAELELDIALAPRPVSSHTVAAGFPGLTVARDDAVTGASFVAAGLGALWPSWQRLHHDLADVARFVAPTLLDPLRTRDEFLAHAPELLVRLADEPVGRVIDDYLPHDVLAGIVGTDALIGMDSSLFDLDLAQNACFLYHVVGNGTGAWNLPVGGMGTVCAALAGSAARAGAELYTSTPAARVDADGASALVTLADGTEVPCDDVVVATSPQVLDRLRGRTPRACRPGSQMKLNMVLRRLPALRSGTPPEVAFAGTFHVEETVSSLEAALGRGRQGYVPSTLCFETYCHTLSDRSILGEAEDAAGLHTLTLFGLHTPARLFANDNDGRRTTLVERYLDALDAHLAEPIRPLLVTDAHGELCIEAHTPLDLAAELGLPGGNIFHGDLSMPWARDGDETGTWGCSTSFSDPANVTLAGAGTRRGGGVSALGGRAAAFTVLERHGLRDRA